MVFSCNIRAEKKFRCYKPDSKTSPSGYISTTGTVQCALRYVNQNVTRKKSLKKSRIEQRGRQDSEKMNDEEIYGPKRRALIDSETQKKVDQKKSMKSLKPNWNLKRCITEDCKEAKRQPRKLKNLKEGIVAARFGWNIEWPSNLTCLSHFVTILEQLE